MKRSCLWARAVLLSTVATPGALRAAETTNYTYDHLGRLVGWVYAGTVNNGVRAATTYDAADNATRKTVTLPAAAARTAGAQSVGARPQENAASATTQNGSTAQDATAARNSFSTGARLESNEVSPTR